MTETKSYNKYQVSKMMGGWQIVIRADNYKELTDAMEEVDPLMDKIEKVEQKRTETQPLITPQTGLTSICKTHNVPMTEAISKKTGRPYFSHRVNGAMCFGKGVQYDQFTSR